ncbi:MAG TPA: nucleotidyltransferase domain-containing protein [Longimicrobiales bacterium]|nr:nucleotidyltransferase domain-containing protein [Longimicrobiales bacterium]
MKTRLALLLTSAARAKLLQLFALFSDEPLRFRDIQRRIGVGSRSLQLELRRLEDLELIARQGRGREVRFRACTDNPLWLPVWQMVAGLARPDEICRILLADLAGVDAAFVYGSVARDDARPDSDVDVFVVGAGVDEIELARRTSEAGALLGREVNVAIYTPQQVREMVRAGHPYIGRVMREPKIWVRGEDNGSLLAA